MKTLCCFLVVTAFAVAGCGGTNDDAASSQVGAVPFDRAFIDAMVPHHRSAIEMAREARSAGLSQPDLIDVARNIIATQQSEIAQMLDWRREWYGPGKPEREQDAVAALGLDAEQAGMTEHGDFDDTEDVDAAFASMMVDHHKGAIEMAELAQQRAGHQEIRDLAGAIIAAQRVEIKKLEPHAEAMNH